MADVSGKIFDAVVVGSGASGGWVVKRLSEAGLDVALVDAGRPLSNLEYGEHKPPFELELRNRGGAAIKERRPIQGETADEYNYTWFADDLDEPYTTAEGTSFTWLGRMRVTGGRTAVWGRQSYRFGEQDFKPASYDGYGEDWPLGYEDVAPYYDIVEDYVGISGQAEGIPELPDSRFLPPMNMNCAERQLKSRVKDHFGRTVTIGRVAIVTKPHNGRSPCHYCGPCHRGCVTHSFFNSAVTTVADALETGRCTHVPNAMVYKVVMDGDRNRAKGVLYVDRNTKKTGEVRGRVVILCAQALESARIMLNSPDDRYPGGVGNSSGALGHYLMDHIWVAGGASGDFPDLGGEASVNGPNRPNGIYVVRFRNTKDGPRTKKFLRGYGFQGGASTGFNWGALGYGEPFKKALRDPVTTLNLGGFGECLPRYENSVEIDPSVSDAYGIPVLRIKMTWGENEHAMIEDQAVTAAEMLEASGARNVESFTLHDREPGRGIHEVGVARMGTNPRTSVLNAFQQSHDVRNLFVMDGAGFTSSACQNPTLTIMALAVRSSDYVLEQMRTGEL